MAHRRSGTERIIAELPTVCWRFRFSISRRGFIFPGAFLFLAVAPPAQRFSFPPFRRDHRPALLFDHFCDATKMIPAASVSRRKGGFFFTQNRSIFVSVAFLTPPTFLAPAPRKRFFDPLPKKILGFRTRKGRLPRRQYLARARLVSSRGPARCGIFAGAGVWYLLRPAGWRRWWRAGRSGGGWLALRLCACAAWYFCAGLRVWYLLRLRGWRRWRMAGRPADRRSWPPSCRPSAAPPTQ